VEAQAKAREGLEALPQMVMQVEAVISLCIRQLGKEVN